VREAMSNPHMSSFIHNIAFNEIAEAMSDPVISLNDACNFAAKVMDRFKNPFIDHPWINITVQYSSKMKMRNIPLLLKHYNKHTQVPENMALGFAAYLLFMKTDRTANGKYYGLVNGSSYEIQDDCAAYFDEKWKKYDTDSLVDIVLADKDLWETDLSMLKGFAEAVKTNLASLSHNGVMASIRNAGLNKIAV
jgi:tagaturonate reductase